MCHSAQLVIIKYRVILPDATEKPNDVEQVKTGLEQFGDEFREAYNLERMAVDGERNIHHLQDQLLVNGRQRGTRERFRTAKQL